MRFPPRLVPGLSGTLVLAASTALAFAPHDDRGLEFPLEWESTPPAFHSRLIDAGSVGRGSELSMGWMVQSHPRTGLVHMAYGGDAFAAN